MQKYKYKAINLQKEEFNGTFIANDERDLAVQLAKQNLFLISCKPYTGDTAVSFFSMSVGSSVKLSELTAFCRQFAIMINSGIPIIQSIDNLRNQAYSTYFKGILQIIYEDVKAGLVLSQALKKHKKVFPNFFQSMVKVGETSGKLELVFNSLADYYEADAEQKRKAKNAMTYPTVLIFMIFGILIVMLVFIVPTFRETLDDMDVELIMLTRIIYDISDFLLVNGLYILAGIAVLGIILFLILRTEKGKYGFDVFKLKCPIIKDITVNMVTARFARGFSLLLTSGVDMIEAMETMCPVLGNRDIEARFRKALEEVRHGMSITMAFETYKLFPDMLVQMVSVGEKTNELDSVLSRSVSYFDEQVANSLSSVTSRLQPIILIIMGLVVGTMFVAVYSPMLSIMTGIGGIA